MDRLNDEDRPKQIRGSSLYTIWEKQLLGNEQEIGTLNRYSRLYLTTGVNKKQKNYS